MRAVGAQSREQTMKTIVPAVLAGIAFGVPCWAQQHIKTEDVVVTATRFEETAGEAPIGVTVITREQIAESGADSVREVLSRVAGIAFRDNTGSPDWQVDMRGFGISGDQNTLVLIDGLRINDNELNAVRWSSITLAAIERIEILRGGGAVLYGAGATGGVINIITRLPDPHERSIVAEAGGGSYHTVSGGGNAYLAGEQIGLRANAQYLVSDNYRDNNALRQKVGDIGFHTLGPGPQLGLSIGQEAQDLGLPGARTRDQLETDRRGATNPDDFSDRRTLFMRATGRATVGNANLALDIARRKKDAEALLFGGFTSVDTRADVWQVAPRFRLDYSGWGAQNQIVAGVDWEKWNYESTRSGPASVTAEQDIRAIYAQHSTQFPSATRVTFGGRLERVYYEARDQESTTPYASGTQDIDLDAYDLAIRQLFADGWSAFARVGTSFRVATLDEIYGQFSGPLFDPEVTFLQPQTSQDSEIGIERETGQASFRGALYHMALENEISLNPLTFTNVNLPPTRRYGAEIDVLWNGGQRLELEAGLSYAYTIAEFREGTQGIDLTGKTVPLVPQHRAAAWVSRQWAQRTRVTAEMVYTGTQFFDNDQTNTFVERMPAYTVFDLRVAHRVGRLQLTASIENLGNEKYFTYGIRSLNPATPTLFNAYPAAERSYFMTAEYRLGPQ
jgi:iron complex outermembrane receptor protein